MQTTITIKAHQCFHLRHIHLQQKGCEAAHCTAHNDMHPVRVFTRMATARSKAEMADDASRKSKEHCESCEPRDRPWFWMNRAQANSRAYM